MAVLSARWISILPLALASCYSPDLRDCTVQCTTSVDCASGQICGADSYCAAPEIAGRCAQIAGPDGGMPRDAAPPGHDAKPPRDATPEPDTPPPIDAAMPTLRVRIMGQGRIEVAGRGDCTNDCSYDVTLGEVIEVRARDDDDWEFDRWTSSICAGEPDQCTFTISQVASEVSAKFRKD